MNSRSENRAADEAKFHDSRIEELATSAESDRGRQSKYYWAVDAFDQELWNAILRLSKNKTVLELGCFSGAKTRDIAKIASATTAIDISPRAVEYTAQQLREDGVHANVFVANAEDLPFPDMSFDVVFGTGIIHHADVAKVAHHIHRVLKPGGYALFREPLGYNPFINLYRRLTPTVRTRDEHPLLEGDLTLLKSLFSLEQSRYFGLSSILSAPLYGLSWGRRVRDCLNALDSIVLRIPAVRKYAWQVNLVMQKKVARDL